MEMKIPSGAGTTLGGGSGDSLEEIRRYGDVTWMEARGGSRGEEYCGKNTNGLA